MDENAGGCNSPEIASFRIPTHSDMQAVTIDENNIAHRRQGTVVAGVRRHCVHVHLAALRVGLGSPNIE